MDRCEVVAVGAAIKTPAGAFTNCLRTKETSPLECGASVKVYAPGVGMVRDDEFLLAKVERPAKGQAKTSMKGWELYVWQQDGESHFSLLVGTNRLKTDEEIAQAAVKGIDAIKPKLDQLKAGQYVFVHGRRLNERAPEDRAKPVAEYCRKLRLKVQ